MDSRILTLGGERWEAPGSDPAWIDAVEEGKVLFFPRLGFPLTPAEQGLLRPELLEAGTRNISWSPDRGLKGVAGGPAVQAAVGLVLQRFSAQALALVTGLFPAYAPHLRAAPASLRPVSVSQRRQSVRADDRRLHVDAFPRARTGANASCACSPTSTRPASPGCGAWASRWRMPRGVSCRSASPTVPGRRGRWRRWA